MFELTNKTGEAYTENPVGRRGDARPEVLVQLRDEFVADAEGFNVNRRQHKSIRFRRGCKGPPESSGRGMQEQMRTRTWEVPCAPVAKEVRERSCRY